MRKSRARGWDIILRNDEDEWRYADTLEVYDDSRPCKHCGRFPTPEGYDACIGYVEDENAISICCGHGHPEDAICMMKEE